MGLLSRLLGRDPTPLIGVSPRASTQTEAILYSGDETLDVVGESYRQDNLWAIVGGRRYKAVRQETIVILVPEPDNAYDQNAIKVIADGYDVGYLSRANAAAYLPGLLRLMGENENRLVALHAAIVGGGRRDDGLGFLGVFIDHDPVDFGIRPHSAHRAGFDSGLSAAVESDPEDDRYDLSWYRTLSLSDSGAIKQLRTLLKAETDPIDRHYMFAELETRLYRCRDAFSSALDDYDTVCSQHHDEMTSIRPTLLAKFGDLPRIDTYRQAAIRCQKAKNWEAMRDWTQRGLEVYGTDAHDRRPVDDLHKRLAYATAKLTTQVTPRPRSRRPTTVVTDDRTIETETLTCANRGHSFQRTRTRGRKPHNCPNCRSAAPHQFGDTDQPQQPFS